MSTEFVSAEDTEFVAFVRWSGNRGRGLCYEFGTVSNFEAICAAIRAGQRFVPINGSTFECDPYTVDELEALAVAERVTFGEFPITIDVFSDELLRFTVEL